MLSVYTKLSSERVHLTLKCVLEGIISLTLPQFSWKPVLCIMVLAWKPAFLKFPELFYLNFGNRTKG